MKPEAKTKLVNEYKFMSQKLLDNLLTFLKVALFLILVFAISIAIVYPLWNIATTNKILYTKIVLITFGSVFAAFTLFKMISYIIKNGLINFFKIKILSFFKKFFSILFTSILFILALSIQSLILKIIAFIFILVLIFLLTGYFKFAKNK